MIKYHKISNGTIAELLPDSDMITGPDDMLDIMADIGYDQSQGVIIHRKNLPEEFFDLKTGLAGEILQKFSNYRMRLAIVGDFTEIKSKSLRDFIRESNTRKIISFVPDLNEAISVLAR